MHAYMTIQSDATPNVRNTRVTTPFLGPVQLNFGPGVDIYLQFDQAVALLPLLKQVVDEIVAETELAATNLSDEARRMAIAADH